jgi:hypothetical protein
VLISVAHRRGGETSAHEAMAAERVSAESLEQLVREHESLVAVANSERWEKALTSAGFPGEAMAVARRSPEWDGLVRVLAGVREFNFDSWQSRVTARLSPAGLTTSGTLLGTFSR